MISGFFCCRQRLGRVCSRAGFACGIRDKDDRGSAGTARQNIGEFGQRTCGNIREERKKADCMKKVIIAKNLMGLFPARDSFLDRSDIRVLEAASNDEVLRACLMEQVDLIVMSLDMPGMAYESLIGNIRTDAKMKEASIVVVCQDTLAHRDKLKHSKVNAIFAMPVDLQLLQLKMQQFLNVAPRMVYRAILAVAVEGKFQSQPLPFWTENLSESGMLIRTEEPLDMGTGVFLSFFLHDGTHITGYGEIVRAQRPTQVSKLQLYGVKFTNIDEEAKTAIRKVVSRTRKNSAR